MSPKTITFALSADLGREIEKRAKEERRTVDELLREAIGQ